QGRCRPRRSRQREDPGLARQGRSADRPRPALPRRRRPPEASGPQQPAEGGARQEGPGARCREGRCCWRRRRRGCVSTMKKERFQQRSTSPLPPVGRGRGGGASAKKSERGADTPTSISSPQGGGGLSPSQRNDLFL